MAYPAGAAGTGDQDGVAVAEGVTPDDAARDARALDERYGRRPSGRRARVLFVAAVVVLAGLAVAWGAWVSHTVSSRPLTWQDVGFHVTGDDAVQVTFDVRFAGSLPRDAQAICTVRALNEGMSEVGLRDVTLGPASRGAVRVTVTVPTSERAVTGVVKECAVAGR
jgi:hypothetical protein